MYSIKYITTIITIRPIWFNFGQGIYNYVYTSENNVYRIYNFTGVLWLQLMVHLTLFTLINFIIIIIIILSY
jgi:hypothetical protein